MKPLAKLGYLAAACALLVTTFAMVDPRAVHAVAAALVQVTNTSANPVPTVDSTAAFPFATTVISDSITPGSFTVPSTTSTGVPVKRLVIETTSIRCDIPSGTANFSVDLQTPNPDPTAGGLAAFQNYFFPVVAPPSGVDNIETPPFVSAPSAVRIYMNPGAVGSLGLGGEFTASGADCVLSLSGHLETQ
jgi:hypothetical protein